MTKANNLKAPREYFKLTEKEKKKIVNQCGPSGFLGKLIPNSLGDVKISESCNIHDYMFYKSKTKKDFKNTDDVFLKNMKLEIKRSNSSLKPISYLLAYLYYGAVRAYSLPKGQTPSNASK